MKSRDAATRNACIEGAENTAGEHEAFVDAAARVRELDCELACRYWLLREADASVTGFSLKKQELVSLNLDVVLLNFVSQA